MALALVEGSRRWFVLDINPEPWAIGPLGVGRKGGRVYPYIGQNGQLDAYKQAVAEEIGTDHDLIEGKVRIRMWFWRWRADYVTTQGRNARKNEVDATNMQKATEDALQGVLFKNDKDVNDIHSSIVDQGPSVTGKVVLWVEPSEEFPQYIFPAEVIELFGRPHVTSLPTDPNVWPPPDDDRPFA